jgi:hypothetical protein
MCKKLSFSFKKDLTCTSNVSHIYSYIHLCTLRTIYYAYIHSILSYGIIFWGRSSSVNKLFILQKKIVRLITNSRVRESCREAFKNRQIMTLYSQYIFSLILFKLKTNPYLPLTMKYINTILGTALT